VYNTPKTKIKPKDNVQKVKTTCQHSSRLLNTDKRRSTVDPRNCWCAAVQLRYCIRTAYHCRSSQVTEIVQVGDLQRSAVCDF